MKKIKKILCLFLSAVLICVSFSSEAFAADSGSGYYIKVLFSGVRARSGPGVSYELVGTIKANSRFTYIGANFDAVDILWYKIKDKNGKTAWVSSNYARRYPETAMKMSKKDEFVSDGTVYSDLQAEINSISMDASAIGVQVAAIRGKDGKIFDWTYGYSKYGVKKMGNATKLRTASISKVITALCAVKMQEDGLLEINKRIDGYWGKKLPVANSMLTLLTHTSGLRYLSITTSKDKYLAQLTEKGNYVDGKPGSSSLFMYNNYGYSVAAATMELILDGRLDDYAKEKIFDPMGLDVSFFAGNLQNTDALATLYEADYGLELTVAEAKHMLPDEGTVVNAGTYVGGFTASARDTAKIFYALSNDGKYGKKLIFDPASVERMEKKYFKAEEYGGTFYQCTALRYMPELFGTEGLYYHTGNAYGVIALATYDPVNKNSVVVFTTGASHARDDNGIYKVCSDIADAVYRNINDL